MHADDGECHRRRSFTICSCGSVTVGDLGPWDSRYVLYCLDASKSTDATLDCLDSWVCWSFVELMHGKWLGHDPWSTKLERRAGMNGKELANGYRGILVFHRGDEKYLQKAYHFSVAWNSERICWRCKASRISTSPLLYTLFGPHAEHRDTLLDLNDYIKQCGPNPWVRLPGFHQSMVCFDLLHIFDLSVVPDAAASALMELSETSEVWPGASQDERLRMAHAQFAQLCRQHRVRILAEFLVESKGNRFELLG